MRTSLEPDFKATRSGAIADEALRACVHCGMCNATCPTYQLTGDELDGPRGRIYLLKQALEGGPVTAATLKHLDRCLGCRACETTCPSGVSYHRLYDIGRDIIVTKIGRPWPDRLVRTLIREVTVSPFWLKLAVALGRIARPLLPNGLRVKIPPGVPVGRRPDQKQSRTMLMLTGCAQSAMARHFNAATARVFAHIGIRLVEVAEAACCGAVDFHLDAQEACRVRARRNIDAWWPLVEGGAEALIVNASGCATFLLDYPDILADDPGYAARAQTLAGLVRDPIEILREADLSNLNAPDRSRITIHEPCTLQNGLKLSGQIGQLLTRLGYAPQPAPERNVCCGSAGAYWLLQPELSGRLREAKLRALSSISPDAIYTANIGCWMQLAGGAEVPVRHWIEAVDDLIAQ